MTRRTTKSATRSLIAVAALGLVLASCGSDEGDPGDAGGGDSSAGEEGADGGTTVEVDEELAAMVPDDLAEAGVLRVGTDASYAPNEFFDEDGSGWIVNNGPPEGTPRYEGHRAIWIQRFDPETQKTFGPRTVLVDGGVDPATNPIWIEGPHIIRRDGWYYLICAEGGTAAGVADA